EVAVCCSRAWLSSREVAVCFATASSSLRVSSAIFFLRLATEAPFWLAEVATLRRDSFALRRCGFWRLVPFIATSSPNLQQRAASVVRPSVGCSRRHRQRRPEQRPCAALLRTILHRAAAEMDGLSGSGRYPEPPLQVTGQLLAPSPRHESRWPATSANGTKQPYAVRPSRSALKGKAD